MEVSRSHTPPSDIESRAKKPRLDDGVANVATVAVDPSSSAHAIPNSNGNDAPPKASAPAASSKATRRALRVARQRERERKILPEACSSEDVLWHDVLDVVGKEYANGQIEAGTEFDTPFSYREAVKVRVKSLGMGGVAVGIVEDEEVVVGNGAPEQHNSDVDMEHRSKVARRKHWAVLVPFALPGELVLARVYRSHRLHSMADFLEILEPTSSLPEVNPHTASPSLTRNDDLVRCRYFSKCGGCQFQMVPYDEQLAWKRSSIVRSYQRFSDLDLAGWDGSVASPLLPRVAETIGSPLQYGYRTKLTPHFDKPPSTAKKTVALEQAQRQSSLQPGADSTDIAGQKLEDILIPSFLKIGFNAQGSKNVMDIEECSIATPVINSGLVTLRKTVASNILNYKKGASLLLRDSLEGTSDESKHICVTEPNSTITERVGPMLFTYPASSFFQNNNAVLPELVGYVKDAIFPSTLDDTTAGSHRPTHLVDAYCGSGLFAISLAPHFSVVSGIELSSASIASARKNTELNRTHPTPGSDPATPPIPQSTSITFASGTAHTIFTSVTAFPRSQTALIIDPPRKGCDENFLQQLVKFGAGTVVYVSCNVVTQARDIGWVLGKDVGEEGESEKRRRYVVESLRGFDLFPQTAHVEGVAVLRLKDVGE